MYGVIGQDDDEASAKKALAVCTELWRRGVWRDSRTVNVIGAYSAAKRMLGFCAQTHMGLVLL
jgi:hypothetical protein